MCAEKNQSMDKLICPIRHAMEIFGGKWKLPIVCILSDGIPLRYSTIKRKLGDITNVMLAQSLKELEGFGIIHREQYNEVPPRVEYSLTKKGFSVLPALIEIVDWSANDLKKEDAEGSRCHTCRSST